MAEQKAKVVKVGRGGPRGPRPKVQNPGKIFMRILRYVMECYRIQVVAVVICIFVSVFANVQGTLFMQTLIDGYILPLLKEQSSDFSGLAHAIARTAGFYGIGIVAAFAQARMMAYVTQGTLKRLRDEMFTHMQTLPIKYFDRNAHGDIMSLYTNDIDTLRQMISQSMPQLLNSAITVVSVLVSMVVLSVPLTVLTLVMVGIMLLVTKYLTTNSSKYFVSQQRDIGAVNGYIEEMMNGQKVVKVFCHEEEAIEQFDKLNDQLFESADKANRYSNLGGPANTQLGNLSYVFCAMIGGALALSGMTGLTLGKLASFLTFNRTLNMPISQISMQFNAIIMALAGGQRIFDLLDEKPEVDEGKVMLVNAKRLPDDSVTETKEQLIERIRNEKYEGLGFPLGYPVFLTSDGRRVRSKSEMMIGDVLENSNVLNQYEKPLDLGRYGKVYPDYTIYDLNRNRIVYWEHFGMIDNPEYANKCVEKYRKYILSGITPFVTFETAIKPLSIDLIKKIAWNFSLDNYDDQ